MAGVIVGELMRARGNRGADIQGESITLMKDKQTILKRICEGR